MLEGQNGLLDDVSDILIIIHFTVTFPSFILIVLIDVKLIIVGARGSVVVEAICYKPEGRGFKSR
jgi:hypothetical protein